MSDLSPRVRGLLDKADEDLRLAFAFLDISPEQAGRLAYMAAFHAAVAAVLSETGKEPKTHAGVRLAFGKLVMQESRLGGELGRFLARAYESKDIADYRTEYRVDRESASDIIDGARQVIAKVNGFLRPA